MLGMFGNHIVGFPNRAAQIFLQILHKHFSAWYNVVLERRLKMGKARAMSDWKLLLRAWNAWRSYVRGQKLERESRRAEQDVIDTHRYAQVEGHFWLN